MIHPNKSCCTIYETHVSFPKKTCDIIKFKYKGVKNGRSKRIDETGKAEK